MRTYNWHFGNLLSSWETGGRIFNLKTIHQLQLRGKKPNALCWNTNVFEMPADMRGDSARKGCAGLIQSKRQAVENASGRASRQAHSPQLCLAFQPLVLQLPFCTTSSSPPEIGTSSTGPCALSPNGQQCHDHSGQLCWICCFSEEEGRKADKFGSENLKFCA